MKELPPDSAVLEVTALQIKILKTLFEAHQNTGGCGYVPHSRVSDRVQTSSLYVLRMIGHTDIAKRAEIESATTKIHEKYGFGRPSLLTLGLVEALTADVDGKAETGYRITNKGLTALKILGG